MISESGARNTRPQPSSGLPSLVSCAASLPFWSALRTCRPISRHRSPLPLPTRVWEAYVSREGRRRNGRPTLIRRYRLRIRATTAVHDATAQVFCDLGQRPKSALSVARRTTGCESTGAAGPCLPWPSRRSTMGRPLSTNVADPHDVGVFRLGARVTVEERLPRGPPQKLRRPNGHTAVVEFDQPRSQQPVVQEHQAPRVEQSGPAVVALDPETICGGRGGPQVPADSRRDHRLARPCSRPQRTAWSNELRRSGLPRLAPLRDRPTALGARRKRRRKSCSACTVIGAAERRLRGRCVR